MSRRTFNFGLNEVETKNAYHFTQTKENVCAFFSN